jgi:hypothetical protein
LLYNPYQSPSIWAKALENKATKAKKNIFFILNKLKI